MVANDLTQGLFVTVVTLMN